MVRRSGSLVPQTTLKHRLETVAENDVIHIETDFSYKTTLKGLATSSLCCQQQSHDTYGLINCTPGRGQFFYLFFVDDLKHLLI